MPTFDEILDAMKRHGIIRGAIVGFGIFCIVVLNLFKSTPAIDLGGNILFGVLILLAMFIPMKK